jgi:hypothetical protein
LAQCTTLSRAIESDHREAELGQRQQKTIEFFDEGIVAAMKDERTYFFPFACRRNPGKCPPG